MKKAITLFSTLAIASVTLVGCSSSTGTDVADDCTPLHEFSTVKDGTLTVGVTDMPPQVSTTGDKGMSGIDAELIELFAAAECLPVTIASGNSGTMIPAVEQGRSDVALGGWNRTAARDEIVGLSDPLYIDPLAIISADGIDTIKALEGQVVGTVDGYNYVPSLQAVFGDNLRLYPTPLDLASDLSAGRIVAAIDGAIAASLSYDLSKFEVAIAKKDDRVPPTVEAAQGALVFNKKNTEILDAFNAFLVTVRDDGSFAKILESFDVPVDVLEVGEPRLLS